MSNSEVDWKKAPKNARWWAIDADGYAHWFVAPNVAACTDFWFSEPMRAPSFGFIGDWRTSLTERPCAQSVTRTKNSIPQTLEKSIKPK